MLKKGKEEEGKEEREEEGKEAGKEEGKEKEERMFHSCVLFFAGFLLIVSGWCLSTQARVGLYLVY